MDMIQDFNKQHNLQTAKQVTYKNVSFPNGFGPFIEALIIEQFVPDDATGIATTSGYLWTDKVAEGGIKLETSRHPFVNNDIDMNISGSQDSLDVIQNILERHTAKFDGVTDPKDIKIKIEYHSELNPKLWEETEDGYKMYPDVFDTLTDAANAFFDFLELPKLDVEDVTITGSSANYNWTSASDMDVHLVVDMKKATKQYGELVVPYFNAQKTVWNDLHDIHVKGIPVEFYVQDADEKHHSTGIFSLQDDEWVVKPEHDKPSIDDQYVLDKAAELIDKIKKIVYHCNKASVFEKLMEKLREMRKAGLEEGGEFSTENLIFKILRNEGYLDMIANCRTKSFDRELSVEEEEEWASLTENEDRDDPWEDIGYTRKPESPVSIEKKTRINLNVPYSQRDSAKRAGAKWDAGIRKWYMLVNNQDLKKIPNAWR